MDVADGKATQGAEPDPISASLPEGETKPEGGNPPTEGGTPDVAGVAPKGEGDKAPDPARQEPPAEYERFSLPDGLDYDEASHNEFAAVARDLGLNQAQAQKLVDLYTARAGGAAEAQMEAQVRMEEQWIGTIRADPEIGGARVGENLGQAGMALEKLGTPGLRQILDDSRLGSHPEMVRFFVRVGALLEEDSPPEGRRPQEPIDPARVLFGDTKYHG